ncbi:ASCH domain-containing protein [Novosphingobium sp.]|uniref:ASCH domain-containing protein n=1 Tax=Novosphingobium sp. TaxID=1874826 RepID=UPI001DFBBF55|nr:ASCH domain-containing protein [Novosphingobium sp.]MBX9661895.1 ASCH domain-containing protein [Novosphingobium sp.]
MKALTIWQPWASLIIAGAKPYEFRGWRPPRALIGQRIVIHAAARKIDFLETRDLLHVHYYRGASDDIDLAARETCLITEKALPILADALFSGDRMPMACGIGTAVVGEPRLGSEIAEEFGVPRANDSDRDEHANWGWPMLEIEAWPTPIPMRGAQGLWNWPEPERVVP